MHSDPPLMLMLCLNVKRHVFDRVRQLVTDRSAPDITEDGHDHVCAHSRQKYLG